MAIAAMITLCSGSRPSSRPRSARSSGVARKQIRESGEQGDGMA
jgi:hypothetical protein